MSDEKTHKILVGLLERATNVLGAQGPTDAYQLMVLFIHHAAHIAKDLIDAETICNYLDLLSAHLPECTEHTTVERQPASDFANPTSTTKH